MRVFQHPGSPEDLRVDSQPCLILLAAGKSSRMGIPKGLLPWQGRSLLEAHCERFHAVGGSLAVVVLGTHSTQYLDYVNRLRKAEYLKGLKVTWCLNPNPDLGQFSSLIQGISFVNSMGDGLQPPAFVQPIDMPPLHGEVYRCLARSLGRNQRVAIPIHDKKSGHPVLLSPSFQKELALLNPSDQHRLDHQIQHLDEALIRRVCVEDENIRLNFNSPSDLPFPLMEKA